MSTAPDIFISYAHPDRETARLFADGFAAEGFEVWWDNSLQAGEIFDERIESALRAAKAVVVLWSPHSVASRWVRAEATLADRNKTLVPAMIAPCDRPIVFELTHTAGLGHWRGEANDREWQTFLANIRRMVGEAAAPAPRSAGAAAPLPRLDQVSVVVLPFANMSSDPEQEYFADGISEDIITDLSKVSALAVISRNSSFTFKGKAVDVPDVARQLNVTHVLEGSVRKSGNRVRVTAQLIDGSTNDHVWADRYDRDLDDIFALQDELAKAIVDALKIKLLPKERKAIESRGTTNIEAYDLYLRAAAANHQFQPGGQGIAHARAALALDPDFFDAWEALGFLYFQKSVMAPETAAESIANGKQAFERAIAIAPNAARAKSITAFQMIMIDKDWLAADAAIEGMEIASRPATYPVHLQELGRIGEAVDAYGEMLRSDPLAVLFTFMFALDCAGRFEKADAESDRMRKLGAVPHLIEYFTALRCMARGDDHAKIVTQFERYLGMADVYLPVHRELLAQIDNPAQALDLLHQAFGEDFYQDAPHMTGIAQMAGYFGDHELVLKCLHEAFVKHRGPNMVVVWHPLMAGARKLEGFKQFARDVGLSDYWRKSGHWGDFARPLGDDDFEVIG
jgi:adenylate cyclase